jgi:hypothetical protein
LFDTTAAAAAADVQPVSGVTPSAAGFVQQTLQHQQTPSDAEAAAITADAGARVGAVDANGSTDPLAIAMQAMSALTQQQGYSVSAAGPAQQQQQQQQLSASAAQLGTHHDQSVPPAVGDINTAAAAADPHAVDTDAAEADMHAAAAAAGGGGVDHSSRPGAARGGPGGKKASKGGSQPDKGGFK